MTDYELMKMVDEDIIFAEDTWENYSHDIERLEILFNRLLLKYISIYDGFADGINVISQYEKRSVKADTLRHNAAILIKRLKTFKQNGYSANGLYEKSVKDFRSHYPNSVYDPMVFNSVRLFINDCSSFSSNYRKELLEKIDDIEQVCQSVDLPERKWEKLRPFLLWLSGKDAISAANILPLLNMIS